MQSTITVAVKSPELHQCLACHARIQPGELETSVPMQHTPFKSAAGFRYMHTNWQDCQAALQHYMSALVYTVPESADA